MRFTIRKLARPADEIDLTPATTAQRTGPAVWVDKDELEIPFDRPLTPAEEAAVRLLLRSTSNVEAQMRQACADYLALTSPTGAQSTAQVRLLTRLMVAVVDHLRDSE